MFAPINVVKFLLGNSSHHYLLEAKLVKETSTFSTICETVLIGIACALSHLPKLCVADALIFNGRKRNGKISGLFPFVRDSRKDR